MSFFKFIRKTRFKYVIPLILVSVLAYGFLPDVSTLFVGIAFGLTIAPLILSETDIELNKTFIYPNEEVLEGEG